jgi:predicted alpha/beta hydrolase family esterase
MADTTIIMVPGWSGSGPEHWQSIWEREHSGYRRVEMRNWQSVERADWVGAVERTLADVSGAVVLVAHSLGCLSVAWWAARQRGAATRVIGAMLVAPPNLASSPGLLPALESFASPPALALPFPSLVAASENDPYATFEEAANMASTWGSELRNAGLAGHINTASGHGPWPEGRQSLQQFIANWCTATALGARSRMPG